MAEMNGAGSQPTSGTGSLSNGSLAGGFEMVAAGMAMGLGGRMSPLNSNMAGLSMTDVTLEQALGRVQELVRENGDLREYLKENNDMMRKQCETLSQWKKKVHEANVMNREKIEQTRALITALRSENEENQVKVRDSINREGSLTSRVKLLESELNALKTAKAASDQLAYNVVKQAEEQGLEMGGQEEENMMRDMDMVYVASAEKEGRIVTLETELAQATEQLNQLKERSAHLEHDNIQFRSSTEQLLNDLQSTQALKQQIEKENKELCQETVELRQQMQSLLADSKNSLQRTNTPASTSPAHRPARVLDLNNGTEWLTSEEGSGGSTLAGSGQDGHLGQTPDRTVEDWQDSSAAVTAEVEQLRRELQQERQKVERLRAEMASSLLQVSELQGEVEVQRRDLETERNDHSQRLQQMKQEHNAQMEHMEVQKAQEAFMQQDQAITAIHAEDVQTLRSQVLTLINEVHETQSKLSAAQRNIEIKNSKIKDLETYITQVSQESRHHVHQLQQALDMGERQLFTEQQNHGATKEQMNNLRMSFNQLVSDYKELLETFDQYKAEQERHMQSNCQAKQQLENINHLTAQVFAAEEAISVRDERIRAREERIRSLELELSEREEKVAVLEAQADVFKCDFEAERDTVTRLATEKDRLCQELESEKLKSQQMNDQLTRYTQQQLHDMQLRASHHFPTPGTPSYPSFRPPFGGGVAGGGGDAAAAANNLSSPEGAPGTQRQFQTGSGGGGGGGGVGGTGAGQNRPVQARQNFMSGGQYFTGGQNYPAQGRDAFGVPASSSPGAQRGDAYHQLYQAQGGGRMSEPRQHDEEEQPLCICPSCDQRLPDYDTLTIHVQDCLDQNASESAR